MADDMIVQLMAGRGSEEHGSSLGLMELEDYDRDQHRYMYSSSITEGAGGNGSIHLLPSPSPSPAQQPLLLCHHHGYDDVRGEEDRSRCAGKGAPGGIVEPTTETGEMEVLAGDGGVMERERRDAGDQAAEDEEAHGVRMMALLMECAVAMSVGNLADANGTLLELSEMASPYSPSCGERLVAYFARAMAARLVSSWVGVCAPLAAPCAGISAAFRAFYNVAPFARSAYLACNHAILKAFHGKRLVHIYDLDVVPGGALQWLSLLPALAARPGGPPVLRVTGFGMSTTVLHSTGKQLAGLATKLSMPFEFYAIAERPGDVSAVTDLPSKRPGEAVAVHWLRHDMYDAAGDDAGTMRLVRWLEPKVVTLVEPDRRPAGGDGGHFLDRFVSALHHYSAVFDSLGASRPAGEDASRHLAENGVLGREIANVLAVAGPTRSGRERFASWQAELAGQGFLRAGGGGRAQLLPEACPAALGYTVADDHDGTVRLGWKGTPLYAVSTWTWRTPPHTSLHGRSGWS